MGYTPPPLKFTRLDDPIPFVDETGPHEITGYTSEVVYDPDARCACGAAGHLIDSLGRCRDCGAAAAATGSPPSPLIDPPDFVIK